MIKKDATGKLIKREETPQDAPIIRQLEDKAIIARLAQCLPKGVSASKLAASSVRLVKSEPKLLKCNPAQLFGCIYNCFALGLEPNTPAGQAYILPFHNKKHNRMDAQLVIGYQGYITIARRSGVVTGLIARAVHEGDHFSVDYGMHPKLEHTPNLRGERGAPWAYYAFAKVDGEPVFIVLTKADVEKFRARSMARNSGPWISDYDAMALKTCVRRLWTWLPHTDDIAAARQLDDLQDTGSSILQAGLSEVADAIESVPELAHAEVPEDVAPAQIITGKTAAEVIEQLNASPGASLGDVDFDALPDDEAIKLEAWMADADAAAEGEA